MVVSILKQNSHKFAPHWLILAVDLVMVLQLFFIAHFIYYDFNTNIQYLFFQLPLITATSLISFLIAKPYKGIVRHTDVKDALNILGALSINILLLASISLLNKNYNYSEIFNIPLSIITIHYLLNIVILISSRYIVKHIYYFIVPNINNSTKQVLIYGAGELGLAVYASLRKERKTNYEIVGFIDDNTKITGRTINQIPIYGQHELSAALLKKAGVKEVIIAINSIRTSRLLEIVDHLATLHLKVKITPPVSEWINSDFEAKKIKRVHIEDLLNRSPINLNNPQLNNEFNGKTVMITGAAGSIGSGLVNQISKYSFGKLVLVDQAESPMHNLSLLLENKGIKNYSIHITSIVDKNTMSKIFNKHQPHIVFHAAAYKHVPLMEHAPYQAIKTNILGTKILADLALENKVEKFVFISTDKAVNPTNVMGASKRAAEIYINCLHNNGKTSFITTRFGNVLGSNGSVIPTFKKQIKAGGPVTVTHKNISRFFMTIPEACQLVLEAGSIGKGGEIYIFDMGESIKIFDIALKMIHLSGLKYPKDINIEITGLRPGEKLYEELIIEGENTIATHHEKILICKIKSFNLIEAKEKIEEICATNQESKKELIYKLKAIVPEYTPQNKLIKTPFIKKELVEK